MVFLVPTSTGEKMIIPLCTTCFEETFSEEGWMKLYGAHPKTCISTPISNAYFDGKFTYRVLSGRVGGKLLPRRRGPILRLRTPVEKILQSSALCGICEIVVSLDTKGDMAKGRYKNALVDFQLLFPFKQAGAWLPFVMQITLTLDDYETGRKWQNKRSVGFHYHPGNKEDVQESDDDKPEARTFVHGLLEEANKWVRECEKSHTSCPFAHEPSLPTRVLDLEALESTATVRLMESHHQQCGCYVALSYVWGKTMPLRLVAKNRKALMNAIDIDKLPKTIRDAVRVTRALNVRYLWVDSLCILQDSDADKELQIPHMNAYYREAVVVISASGATDVHAGFLGFQSTEDEIIARAQSRLFADHPKYGPVPYSLGISWPENIRKNEVLCLIDVDPPLYDYNKEPINGRGWTLQESSLARRLLIFPGTGGIIMRCAKGESFAGNVLGNPFREEAGSLYHESGIIDKSGSEREKEVSGRDLVPSRATDEGTEDRDDKEDVDEEGGKHVYDNVDDSKRSINQDDNQNDENKSDEKSKKDREEYYNKLMFPETSREDKISQEWYAFVQDYSHRALSEPGDILIALGALAQQYQSQHDDVLGKYVAGLWTERLSEGLLWHLAYPRHQGRESFIQPRKEVSEHHAPSWSWASCGQPVTFHTQREPELAQFGIRNESYASKFDQPSWCIEIMGCSMMPRNEQFPFGAVQAAHIDVKGVLMPIRRVSGQVWSAHSTDRCAIDDLALLKADGSLPYHLSTDLFAPDSVKALEKIDDSCHWLPVYDAARSRARGLIVCELDSGLYQRLGFAQFDVGFDFSTKLEKKRVIRLI